MSAACCDNRAMTVSTIDPALVPSISSMPVVTVRYNERTRPWPGKPAAGVRFDGSESSLGREMLDCDKKDRSSLLSQTDESRIRACKNDLGQLRGQSPHLLLRLT